MPTYFYTLQLLQRNYQIAKKAHTIYAFGILKQDKKRVKGGTGWTVQLAMDQGKPVYLFDIPSQSWYHPGHWQSICPLGAQKAHPSSKQCYRGIP